MMRVGCLSALVIACIGGSLRAEVQATSQRGKVTYSDEAMGTKISVWFWTDRQTDAARAAEALFAEMKRLDLEMTTWRPDSDVSRINAAAGVKPVVVSNETLKVIAKAIDISRRSGGLFDITVKAFHGLWKFDQDMDGSLPDPAEVKKRVALVNWKDIVVNHRRKTVYLRRKGMAITLGGIAKGYAVDRCAHLLRSRGFADFMIQAGGDMYIAGSKGPNPWVVGIRDPRGPADSMFATAPIKDHSFSTSGDYERGFVKNGVRYHHILDPSTGQPSRTSRSVTIRAKDAFTADAWSKVMFMSGWQKGMELIRANKLRDFEAVWVAADNTVHMTKGIERDLRKLRDPSPGT